MKYLVDTCVWRDFYEDREGFKKEKLGFFATKFFKIVLKKKHKIIYSKALIKELKIAYDKVSINQLLSLLIAVKVLELVEIKEQEFKEAKNISKKLNLPFVDCLNAVQARNHRAILITQDKHFFYHLKDICVVKRPQDIN